MIELLRADHDRLATKENLALGLADVRTEVADVRAEIADVRTEMAELRTELRTEMAELRSEFRVGMADLRVQFTNDITAAFAVQTKTLVIGLISAVILIALSNAVAVVAG